MRLTFAFGRRNGLLEFGGSLGTLGGALSLRHQGSIKPPYVALILAGALHRYTSLIYTGCCCELLLTLSGFYDALLHRVILCHEVIDSVA
eukprot:1157731-Pelagomonas_calceolata.AAC.19